MKGLEVTVLKFSEVRHENRVFRFDPQFFGKEAIATENTLKSQQWETLGQASTRIESFGAYALTNQFSYVESGIPFLRCVNIKNGFADLADCLFISPEAHQLLSKSVVEAEMVLLTMSGSVGEAAVALPNWEYPVNSNQDVAKITARDGVSPYFLTAFLNSRYGRIQAERLPIGSVQQHIFLWMLEQLVVVRRFSEKFEAAVARAVRDAYGQRENAQQLLAKAEATLTAALGLGDWQPPEPLTYTRPASEAFAAGRLDAEHFQPKFQSLIKRIKTAGFPVEKLGDIMLPVKNGYDCRNFTDEGTPYIRVGDISGCRIHLETAEKVPLSVEQVGKDIALKIGDVLFTRKGSYGNAAPVRDGEQHAIISSEIMLIRRRDEYADKILPEFLAMFLNSIGGSLQAEQWAHGVAFYSISQDDLSRFFIPIIPMKTQKQLCEKLSAAETASARARELLERAKRAVEIAIERDERAALDSLKD